MDSYMLYSASHLNKTTIENNLVTRTRIRSMVEEIIEDDVPIQESDPAETVFNSLSAGDTVTIFAWGGGDEYIKTEFTVSNVHRDTSEKDDTILGTIGGESSTLRLPWYPAEPNVGISRPYSEPPVRLEYDDKTYDISVIQS